MTDDATPATDLEPCPFCGRSPEVRFAMDEHWVLCRSCKASAGLSRQRSSAISTWNTRAAPPPAEPIPERTEGVREAVADIVMDALMAVSSRFAVPSDACETAADAIIAALSPHAATGGAHFGDPCIYCGIGHDDVPAGPCSGGRISISKAGADKILGRLKAGPAAAGWPTQLWVEVQQFIGEIQKLLEEAARSAPPPATDAVTPLEVAYGALWRTHTDSPALHAARKAVLAAIGGQGSDGQRRGVQWSVETFGGTTDAEVLALDIDPDSIAAPPPAEEWVAALVEAEQWHSRRAKALSKQPPSSDRDWRLAEHREERDRLRQALSRAKGGEA